MRFMDWLLQYCHSREGMDWMQTENTLKKLQAAAGSNVKVYPIEHEDMLVCIRALKLLKEQQDAYREREWNEE